MIVRSITLFLMLVRELVIIGCGIQGVMTALVAHAHGFRDIVVYDKPCALDLGPDTLRNHAWLQSGLLYAMRPGPLNRAVAVGMYRGGVAMIEEITGERIRPG